MTEQGDHRRWISIRLVGNEGSAPLLLNVAAFLYDFNLFYEVSRLAVDAAYEHVALNPRTWTYRRSRPLRAEDRLQVSRLRHESPIELVTAVTLGFGAISAAWAVFQGIERIVNFPLSRKLLTLQVAKAELDLLAAQRTEAERLQLPTVGTDAALEARLLAEPSAVSRRLDARDATVLYNRALRRIEQSEIELTEFDIEIVDDERRPLPTGRQ